MYSHGSKRIKIKNLVNFSFLEASSAINLLSDLTMVLYEYLCAYSLHMSLFLHKWLHSVNNVSRVIVFHVLHTFPPVFSVILCCLPLTPHSNFCYFLQILISRCPALPSKKDSGYCDKVVHRAWHFIIRFFMNTLIDTWMGRSSHVDILKQRVMQRYFPLCL